MLMHIIKSHRGSMMIRSVEHEGKSQFSRGPDSKPSFPPLRSSFELIYAIWWHYVNPLHVVKFEVRILLAFIKKKKKIFVSCYFKIMRFGLVLVSQAILLVLR